MKKISEWLNNTTSKINKKDWIVIGALILVYTIISFYKLGSFINPQTFTTISDDVSSVSYELKNEMFITKLRYFSGSEIGDFDIYIGTTINGHRYFNTFTPERYFSWFDVEINSNIRSLIITGNTTSSALGEIALYDNDNNIIDLIPLTKASNNLIDEQDTIPLKISYYNSVYWDEVFFPRAAYEMVHDIPINEWTHPPLGKLIQAFFVALFGMRPFVYRFPGNIAGILMIPVIYILAKKMFKKNKYALLAALLMTFDCFHFVQTRMATTDSVLTLFILSSFLFMYMYIDNNKLKIEKKLLYLFLSGLFIGLAICVKWSALFAGFGLAVVFFINFIKNTFFNGNKWDIESTTIIISCIIFFVMVPVLLYLGCYFLFPNGGLYQINTFKDLFNETSAMYNFHSTLTDAHTASSKWWQWPLIYNPIWFSVNYYADGTRSTISALGNPAIWWFGIPSFFYTVYDAIRYRKKEVIFILITIITTWLPYVFIKRPMFIYHFFPTLPFWILSIVVCLRKITELIKKDYVLLIYILLVIFLFILFYPIIAGAPVTATYADFLKWLPTWNF